MAITPPDHQERAAMSAPLLPRQHASLSSSSSSSFSSTSSSFSTDAAPMMPMPRDASPCKALAVFRDAHAGGGSVSCLSLCGEFLLSASTGADIVAWQQPDLRLFARFGGGGCGEGSVKALAAAGGRVFSAHQDGRVRVSFKLVACSAGSGSSTPTASPASSASSQCASRATPSTPSPPFAASSTPRPPATAPLSRCNKEKGTAYFQKSLASCYMTKPLGREDTLTRMEVAARKQRRI